MEKKPTPWNKGFTKETHPSIAKTSRIFRKKRIDNFASWRQKMRDSGKLKSVYPELQKDKKLAELIGVVLGDGYIGEFPRTEVLRIVCNSNNRGFIERCAKLVENVFDKKPHVSKRKLANCVDVTIYEKYISKRLKISAGARKNKTFSIPQWIIRDKNYTVGYLRGLYESEGSFAIHKPTYTYKFIFKNNNKSLLENVHRLLTKLGFHPHVTKNTVQVSRKEEVYRAKKLLKFREY